MCVCVCEKRFPILHFPLPLPHPLVVVLPRVHSVALSLWFLSLMQCFLLMHIHTHMHMHLPHVSLTCLLTSSAGQQQFLYGCISRANVKLYGRADIVSGLHTTLLISTHTCAYSMYSYFGNIWQYVSVLIITHSRVQSPEKRLSSSLQASPKVANLF